MNRQEKTREQIQVEQVEAHGEDFIRFEDEEQGFDHSDPSGRNPKRAKGSIGLNSADH